MSVGERKEDSFMHSFIRSFNKSGFAKIDRLNKIIIFLSFCVKAIWSISNMVWCSTNTPIECNPIHSIHWCNFRIDAQMTAIRFSLHHIFDKLVFVAKRKKSIYQFQWNLFRSLPLPLLLLSVYFPLINRQIVFVKIEHNA